MLMSSSLKVDNDGVRPGVGLHLVQAAGEGTSLSELSEHPSSSPPGPQLAPSASGWDNSPREQL